MHWPIICGNMALSNNSVHEQVFGSHFGNLYRDIFSTMTIILARAGKTGPRVDPFTTNGDS